MQINLTEDLKREEIFGTFYEKELQKTNQTEFRVEKLKRIKQYLKWRKGFNKLFNCWINKKDIV